MDGPVPTADPGGQVYRHGTFQGCAYYLADGRVRTMDAGLKGVAEWVTGLVARAGRADPVGPP